MKRFKHAISFAMAIVMIASISSAMAAEPTNELSMSPQAERNFNAISPTLRAHILADESLSSAAVYAYLDLDTAPISLRDDILKARDVIIHSEGWTVDGTGFVVQPDGTTTALPKFSDLFPGWDLPVWDTPSPSTENSSSQLGDSFGGTLVRTSRDNVSIPKFNSSVSTKSMGTFKANSSEIFQVTVRSLSTCSTCNIGASTSSGVSQGWAPRVAPGGKFYFYPDLGTYYSVRVSTYDSPGRGNFYIFH